MLHYCKDVDKNKLMTRTSTVFKKLNVFISCFSIIFYYQTYQLLVLLLHICFVREQQEQLKLSENER